MAEAVQMDVTEKSGAAQGCLIAMSGQALLEGVSLLVIYQCF